MGVQDLLNLAERQGASFSLAGGDLRMKYPEGCLNAGLRATIQSRKGELIAYLAGQDTTTNAAPSAATQGGQGQVVDGRPSVGEEWEPEPPRPFGPDDHAAVLAAVERLRQEHGRTLRDAGWDRQTLWRGLLPENATSWQTVPGLLHRLMCGDSIQNVTPQRILLSSGLAWFRGGYWLAGEALRRAEGGLS